MAFSGKPLLWPFQELVSAKGAKKKHRQHLINTAMRNLIFANSVSQEGSNGRFKESKSFMHSLIHMPQQGGPALALALRAHCAPGLFLTTVTRIVTLRMVLPGVQTAC